MCQFAYPHKFAIMCHVSLINHIDNLLVAEQNWSIIKVTI